MTRSHDCEAIREMVFNYRRGELSELDAALFEESLITCHECATYVGRIIDMLDVSVEAEAQDYIERPIDASFADSLFDSIAAQIEAPASEDGDELEREEKEANEASESKPPVRLEFVTQSNLDEEAIDDELFDFEDEQHASRWPRYLAAAAVLLGIGIGALVLKPWEEPAQQDNNAIAENDQEQDGADLDEASATPDAALAKAFQQLQPQNKTSDTIKVFASDGAKWRLEGKAPDHKLRLEQGTVLVEFLPKEDNERLHVVSGETEVAVLGTVFYVSAEEPGEDKPARVGVITGKVRVKQPASGKEAPVEVMLEDGQESKGGVQIRAIEPSMKQQTEAFVDIKAHQKALAERHEAPKEHAKADIEPPVKVKPEEDQKVAATAPVKKVTSDEDLRKQAQKALRERDYSRAAKNYERLLERLPKAHNERASIRLELARLYMRYLGQRERAIDHLREFVEQHPLDVAAPSARRQLCQLLGMRASKDPACISLQMD